MARKLAVSALFLLLALAIAFLPQYLTVCNGFGLPQMTALANSLTVFARLPSDWIILQVLLLTAGGLLLLAVGGCALILSMSRKTKDSILTMLASGTALLLPPLFIILFLTYGR